MTSEELAQLGLALIKFRNKHVDPVDYNTLTRVNDVFSDVYAEMEKQQALGN